MKRQPQALVPAQYCGNSRIEALQSRIQYKMRDYASYQFSERQSYALNIFFDLAQEYDDSASIHLLCVFILRQFFGIEAEFYTRKVDGTFALRTPQVSGSQPPPAGPEGVSCCDGTRCILPVRGKGTVFLSRGERLLDGETQLGVLVLYLSEPLDGQSRLFLEKFANRVGFCLHNRLLAERNSRHILFVRKLAHDIGHNVISPNMQFKLMLGRLEEQVDSLGSACVAHSDETGAAELVRLHGEVAERLAVLKRHFRFSSMFLESLLRQSHFDEGHYVLRRSRLDLRTQVVIPQFERYLPYFTDRNIRIPSGTPSLPAEECRIFADLGLISQVLANLLSNAVKYCARPLEGGEPEAWCGVDVLPGFFPGNVDGLRVRVRTTGPPIPPEEARHLFQDNYRASNAEDLPGSGHGLFFVREITSEHGGAFGYTPGPEGNTFFFILPRLG